MYAKQMGKDIAKAESSETKSPQENLIEATKALSEALAAFQSSLK